MTDDGLGHTEDQGATFTKKHGRTYHGYKAHIATNTQGVITDHVFDMAKGHDSQHMGQLIEEEDQGVYADSGYMHKDRKQRLESDSVFCGIVERLVRGPSQLTRKQVEHHRACAAIRAIVEHPFAWMKHMGYRFVRYWGLVRNGFDLALMVVAYNFKRCFSLVKPVTCARSVCAEVGKTSDDQNKTGRQPTYPL